MLKKPKHRVPLTSLDVMFTDRLRPDFNSDTKSSNISSQILCTLDLDPS